MTQEQQARLDELAELVRRKGPCPDEDCAGGYRCDPKTGILSRHTACDADGNVFCYPNNLRKILWEECPGCTSGGVWPMSGVVTHYPGCTGYIRRTWDTPKGALAGALLWTRVVETDGSDYDLLDGFDRDDVDEHAVSVTITALKAQDVLRTGV